MRIIPYFIPFIYAEFFIIAPMLRWNVNYWQSMVLFFWLPCLILCLWNWHWMSQYKLWKPFFLTWIILNAAAVVVELTSLKWGIWDFGTVHPLLYKEFGINPLSYPFGVPAEEFMFYWGATPFCFMLYIYFFRLIKKEKESEKKRRGLYFLLGHLAWVMVALPFIPFLKYMGDKLKEQKVVSWSAVWLSTAVFYATMAIVEIYSVHNQHWVYDYSKAIFFVKPWNIPIEEYALYYLLGPIFVVFLFHFLELRPTLVFNTKSTMRTPID